MANPQLRLVQDQAPGFNPDTRDETRIVFEHWLYMLGRSPRRCKLGPTRRAAINGALAMGYEVDALLLAIEGMAADPLHLEGRPDAAHMRDAMREIEWLLAKEARIERWMDRGEALRERALRPVAEVVDHPVPTVDPEAEAKSKEACRAMAARLRGGGVRHG